MLKLVLKLKKKKTKKNQNSFNKMDLTFKTFYKF